MPQPTFSLAYTTVRSERVLPVIQDWLTKAENPNNVEVVISFDEGDKATLAAITEAVRQAKEHAPGTPVFSVVQKDQPFNCVKGWNTAVANTTGKVIICIADDFVPPACWDRSLLELPVPGWTDQEWIVHVDDGFVRDICTLAILTRKRYEHFGYAFYPEYESLFCDTEFTERAYQDGAVISGMHLLFEHQHPDCGKRIRDGVDDEHASNSRWKRGEMLFNYRKHRGFVNDTGLGKPDEQTINPKPVVYIQAIRNDFCLEEVCTRMIEEGIRVFFFSVPDEYWSGRPVTDADLEAVSKVAILMQTMEASVHTKIFRVASYRLPTDTRIIVETRIRNASLSWIRENGYTRIFVVDGDELWPHGTLAKLMPLVEEHNPHTMSCSMVPVAGFPGCPIDSAVDSALVYIGRQCIFKVCRSPLQHWLIPNVYIIHFSSTRRTLEETVQKHRDSGHYDDVDYDFEGWIRDTLPNIKPGFKNVHMFRPSQIWPMARAWKKSEYAEIPDTIKPFLIHDVQE